MLVIGRLTTDTWTDKDTGVKHTAPRVLADAVDALTGGPVRVADDGYVWLAPYAAVWAVGADAR